MSLEQYKVFNLINDVTALKVLLILESPHIQEYIHQHPAAGESALELTRFLQSQGYLCGFDASLPVGCNIKTLSYQPLGILNCATLPMNQAFYPCTLASDELAQVNELAAIKQRLGQKHTQKLPAGFLQTAIFKDFATRLTHVLKQASPDLIVVPCGDTATGFMHGFQAIYEQPVTVLDSLPHPTEADWAKKIRAMTHDKTLTRAIPTHLLP